jgi:hypothetical protein
MPLRIDVRLVWYNGMGGHPAISFAGEFLLMESGRSYGSSFDSIELYPHVPSRSHDPNLSTVLDRFNAHIRVLPQSWIKRKSRRIEISYNSELGYEEELVGKSRTPQTVSQFSLACHEISAAMIIITKRLKTSDDFALDKLREQFEMRLRLLPATDAELHAVLETLRLEDRKRLIL